MSITAYVVESILDRLEVPDGDRQDPELLGAAYALAFLEEPHGSAEQRFYDSVTTLPGDTADDLPYEMPVRDMLTEIYEDRILERVLALGRAEFVDLINAMATPDPCDEP